MEIMDIKGQPQIHHDRIRAHSTENANRRIDFKTEEKIRKVIYKGRGAILHRIDQLDKEWDIDRILMLNFSAIIFAQLVAARKNRKWLWGPLIQTPFMFLHATIGWCPPSLWFRPLGFRTRHEIQAERDVLMSALKNATELLQ